MQLFRFHAAIVAAVVGARDSQVFLQTYQSLWCFGTTTR